MKRYLLLLVIAGLGILITTNCTNDNKPKKTEFDSLEIEVDKKQTNQFESSFNAPSPSEIFSLFEDSGVKFNSALLPNPKTYENNLTSNSLSNSLGIYIADVAYLNMFNQYGLMTTYLESIFTIADELDLTGIYSEFDFKKVFKEMDNPDSLEVLSEDLYIAITNYMTDTDNETTLCLVYYSSYIELLYLVLNPIEVYDENSPIIQHITLQREGLIDLHEFAIDFNNNPAIKIMLSDLEKINKIWDDSETTETETHISKTEDGKLSIGGGITYKLTKTQFELLKNTVSEIRNQIIK